MSRRKEPTVPSELLDQLLAGGPAAAAFEQGGSLDSLKKALTGPLVSPPQPFTLTPWTTLTDQKSHLLYIGIAEACGDAFLTSCERTDREGQKLAPINHFYGKWRAVFCLENVFDPPDFGAIR